MLSALTFAGYDVKHAWGEGGHNGKHAAAIMPDALRWLWRDHPQPIGNVRGSKRRTSLLIPGEDWELVSDGHKFTEGPAVNSNGEVFFTDIPNSKIHKIDLNGHVSVFTSDSRRAAGLMFGPDGQLLATCRNQIVMFDADGRAEVVVDDAPCNDLVVMHRGGGYYTDPKSKKVWHVDEEGSRRVVDEGIEFPNGLITSADQTLLHVADSRGRFIYCYQIQDDGTLAHKQRYGYLHIPDTTSQSGADGMTVDTQGRLYVTSKVGLQVLDQLGRVHFIFANPGDRSLTNVVFGGSDLSTLYVTAGDKVFRRENQRPWCRTVAGPCDAAGDRVCEHVKKPRQK